MKRNILFKSLLFSLIMILLFISVPFARVNAADGKGTASYNLHNHNYRYGTWYNEWNWTEVSKSYMYSKDGKPVRVEALSDKVIVEFFSPEFNLDSSKNINLELPVFGGFFCGKDALYIMFGQNNTGNSDTAEVVRIVKYDFNWNRLGSVSYYGENTSIPFDAGASDFAEYGNILYVRTCHEMYSGHQANMTFAINISNMTGISSYTEVMNIGIGYVSHSFNQFIRIDGDKIVAVDHGDAHPRSVVLGQYPSSASEGRVDEWSYQYVNLLGTPGNSGANFTGTSLGGFEVSQNNYLVAVSKVAYDDNFTSNKVRNVSVLIQPKGNFDTASTKEVKFTSYAEGSGKGCANPYLVKVSDNVFVLMWEDLDTTSAGVNNAALTNTFEAVVIDGNGNKLSDIKTFTGALSDCQPIAFGGNVYWYGAGKSENNQWGYLSSSESAPVFYEIKLTKSGSSYSMDMLRGDKDSDIYFGNKTNTTPDNPTQPDNPANTDQVTAFVKRFYKEVLGRSQADIDKDTAGIANWTNALISGQQSGAEVAYGFVNSSEFRNRDLNNDQFVKTMYKSFFDRNPDAGGYKNWYDALQNGSMTRLQVLEGFTQSKEFKDLCASYSINPGTYTAPAKPQDPALKPLNVDTSGVDDAQLSEFIERLYDKALNRHSDADGKEYWKGCIINGHDADGRQYDIRTVISKGFLNSQEYKNRDRNNAEFVADCYAAFFNRDPRGTDDEVNYWKWVQALNDGMPRQQLIENGFGNSPEFKNLITSYGFVIK